MAKRKKQTKLQKKLRKFKRKFKKFISGKAGLIIVAVLFLVALFFVTFFITTAIFDSVRKEPETELSTEIETTTSVSIKTEKNTETETTTSAETTTSEKTTVKQQVDFTPGNTVYPSDTASWQLICVNRNRYVSSDVENSIKLSYVAGSGERMDYRAAAAYEKMYDAAAKDGYYLTPCSGYRSYSTQKRLYYEFYNEYIGQGYDSDEAHDLTSRRRNPPGSSEHNLGICMDIICASSSANFQNTNTYKWLCENAADYGFILRYPEDKVSVTGVKFEPWHWRYVGVENAAKIKNSGLCLEEYLGLA